MTYITLTLLLCLCWDCWCLPLVFVMLEWCTQEDQKEMQRLVFMQRHMCLLGYIPIWLLSTPWRHCASNSHCNEWLPAALHTHIPCSSRLKELILITEQWKATVNTIICLLERRSKWCSFSSGPVSSVYCSCQLEAAPLRKRMNFLFCWDFVSVGVCVCGRMLSRVKSPNRIYSLLWLSSCFFSPFLTCCSWCVFMTSPFGSG